MKWTVCILIQAFVLSAVGGKSDGVSADSITVSLDAVTMPVANVTVPESSVAYSADDSARRRNAIAFIRSAVSESERLKKMADLWNQDDIFYLLFKPGEDTNTAVRVAAVNGLAEIEILKAFVGKIKIREIEEAVTNRLNTIYVDGRKGRSTEISPIVRQYARRLRSMQ